jgi:hypothetical protein
VSRRCHFHEGLALSADVCKGLALGFEVHEGLVRRGLVRTLEAHDGLVDEGLAPSDDDVTVSSVIGHDP